MPSLTKIEGNQIVIRININHLPIIADVAMLYNGWCDDQFVTSQGVTNPTEFAKDLIREMDDEDEEGATFVTDMIDKAIIKALENGAAGVTEK